MSIHLFAKHILVDNHNKSMIETFHMKIALSIAKFTNGLEAHQQDDDQLEKQIFLYVGQRVMLSCNLWVQAELVNGGLGVVMQIVYAPGHNPPNLPSYIVLEFNKYIEHCYQ